MRITDNRPGAAPAMTGLDHLAGIQSADNAEHDKAVAGYNPETLEAAWEDLQRREAWDRKNPEHRWVMNRRAALRRRGLAMVERGLV